MRIEYEPPITKHHQTEREEANFVLDQLKRWLDELQRKPSDICIVARTNKLLDSRYAPLLQAAGYETQIVKSDEAKAGEGIRLATMPWTRIASLEPAVDPRVVRAKVAGPGALLVAKMFKIHERRGSARANDKDALDVLRILQGVSTDDLAHRLTSISDDARSATTGARALQLFTDLFGNRGGEGAAMAARAAQPVMDADQVRLTCEVLAGDLLEALG